MYADMCMHRCGHTGAKVSTVVSVHRCGCVYICVSVSVGVRA
jgi:hypothetical protein